MHIHTKPFFLYQPTIHAHIYINKQIQYKYVQIYTYTDSYIHICTFILSHFSLYQPTIHAHICIYMHIHTNMLTCLSIFACMKTVLVCICLYLHVYVCQCINQYKYIYMPVLCVSTYWYRHNWHLQMIGLRDVCPFFQVDAVHWHLQVGRGH